MGQSIHSFVDFDVDVVLVNKRYEVVIVDDFLGNKFDGDAHVFRVFERRVEVEFFYADGHKVCSRFGDDAIK